MSDVDTTKLVLWAVSLFNGQPSRADGTYLVDVDFAANDGLGATIFHPSWEKAKTFDCLEDAFAFVNQCSPVTPIFKGRPYRPLHTWVYGAAPIGVLLMLESQTATKQ